MKFLKTVCILAISGLLVASCGNTKKENTEAIDEASEDMSNVSDIQEEQMEEAVPETPTIVEVASGNDSFTTLVAAVKAADLAETLGSEGPFTVFAPTNDAFNKLPEGTVEGLLKPESKDKLTSVLTYHVVSGKFEAAAVIDAINKNNGKFTVDTVQGEKIELSLKDGNVILTDANGGMAMVVMPDVAASNGVIHAIDTVVMPK